MVKGTRNGENRNKMNNNVRLRSRTGLRPCRHSSSCELCEDECEALSSTGGWLLGRDASLAVLLPGRGCLRGAATPSSAASAFFCRYCWKMASRRLFSSAFFCSECSCFNLAAQRREFQRTWKWYFAILIFGWIKKGKCIESIEPLKALYTFAPPPPQAKLFFPTPIWLLCEAF